MFRGIRVISLDLTGTLIRHKDPIYTTYANALVWSRFPNPPSANELKPAFKKAYYETLMDAPCFGSKMNMSSKQWWVKCVKKCLEYTDRKEGKEYSEIDFNRFFRRVYQHYGGPEGYALMDDALPFVKWATEQGYLLGVTTNTPSRTMDSVISFMGLHQYMRFFVCSQDCGFEKPDKGIFMRAMQEIDFNHEWMAKEGEVRDLIRPYNEEGNMATNMMNTGGEGGGGKAETIFTNTYTKFGKGEKVKHDQVLHIGDNLQTDLCGAKAFGWQGIHLDRSTNPNVRVYQDWLEGPDYPGKSQDDILKNTVVSLDEVRKMLLPASQ